MTPVEAWLADIGLLTRGRYDLIEAAVAFGFVMLSLLAGHIAGRWLGPPLAETWRTRIGEHAEGFHGRVATVVRHATAALLLAILARAWPWPPLAALGIGIALGAAAAALVVQLLRGVHLARWIAWTVAALVFVALLSQSVGGLQPITDTLDAIGFNVGRRRVSLLAGLTLLLTIVVLLAVVRIANRAVGHALAQTRGLDATQRLLAQKLAGIALLIAAFFFGIDALGIDLTTFAVFGGAFGLAIGFGLQKTVGNLIAGIILLMDRSIKPGDVIAVGDSFGWVNKIGVRAVSVITREGKEHLIPNEILMTQEVENWSFSDRNVRVGIPVKIAYDSDVALAERLMMRAATESSRVLDTPAPAVWMTSFGDYALEYEVRVWISDPEGGIGSVKADVLKRLWTLFGDHGIRIPVPQRDVRLVEVAKPGGQAQGSA
ncbi:mechanosensitive ion channel [Sphingomonas donggukensis]|uniref:Mechanosensitive ion channel n=1 Tax=Sphingomonas donggukensis TaxID=2949093 RepID=A0ABY4TTI3_9SPHN|nr:mechanosensitive ion channel domain-containing protein [Sphingomonas donggukensis]URW75707.1 mechanosensitive ion channel [Sphingomonas donggukensis]